MRSFLSSCVVWAWCLLGASAAHAALMRKGEVAPSGSWAADQASAGRYRRGEAAELVATAEVVSDGLGSLVESADPASQVDDHIVTVAAPEHSGVGDGHDAGHSDGHDAGHVAGDGGHQSDPSADHPGAHDAGHGDGKASDHGHHAPHAAGGHGHHADVLGHAHSHSLHAGGNSPGQLDCITLDRGTLAVTSWCPPEEQQKFITHFRTRTVVGIALALSVVAMTVIFEEATHRIKHYLSEHNSMFAAKLFNQVLQELAILGFVALCFFAFSTAGGFDVLNRKIFGTAHGGHHDFHGPWDGHTIPELGVMFEQLHFVLFNIMVLYIATFVWLFWIIRRTVSKWRLWEQVPPQKITAMYKAGDRTQLADAHIGNIMQFYTFRQEILCPCDDAFWLEEHTGVQVTDDLETDFPLSDYLKDLLGTKLLRMVALPKKSLLLLCITSVLTNPLKTDLTSNTIGHAYLAISIPVTIWAILIVYKIHQIYAAMTPPLESMVWDEDDEDNAPVPLYRNKDVVLPTSASPLWTWWGGTAEPTHHQALFWRWAHGPRWLSRNLQSCLFCTIILWASCLESCKEHSEYWADEWGVLAAVLAPGMVLLCTLPWTIAKFGMITSIRDFVDADVIVLHSQAARRRRLARELLTFVVARQTAKKTGGSRAVELWKAASGGGPEVDLGTALAQLSTICGIPYGGELPDEVGEAEFLAAAETQIRIAELLEDRVQLLQTFEHCLEPVQQTAPQLGGDPGDALRKASRRRATARSTTDPDRLLPGATREGVWKCLDGLGCKEEVGELLFARAGKRKIVGRDMVEWITETIGKAKPAHGAGSAHQDGAFLF